MTERLLVDGFNFTHHIARDGRLSGGFKESVYALENYAARTNKPVTAVFDGTRFEGTVASSAWMRVVFSKPREAADQVLERLMQKIEPSERLLWTLVSDDRALRQMALGLGLRVRRPAELLEDMLSTGKTSGAKLTGRKPFNRPFDSL